MKADTILCRRVPAMMDSPRPHALVPTDDRGAELLAKIPLGEDVAVQIRRGRSLPQHRLFWAVLQHVAKSSQWETPERLLVALKIRLGRYDLMTLPAGKVVPVPHSISFSEMTQDAFQQFMDSAIGLICSEVIPGMDSAQLIAEAQHALGIRAAEPAPAGRAAEPLGDPPPPQDSEPNTSPCERDPAFWRRSSGKRDIQCAADDGFMRELPQRIAECQDWAETEDIERHNAARIRGMGADDRVEVSRLFAARREQFRGAA